MWNYFFNWKLSREAGKYKKEGNYCMMSDLEKQLYGGRHALFDLKTIKIAFQSLWEESCVTGAFTAEYGYSVICHPVHELKWAVKQLVKIMSTSCHTI